MAMPSSRIPVFLLTGFLGSGKTTLLNRLMQARPESRGKLAVIVNEFGQVGMDADLLPRDITRQVELPGGCICCVLNNELDQTILGLVSGTPDIDTIVIETTGVAEPLPIAWTLDQEPVSERVRLAAVITVVDVLHFEDSRPLSPAVDAQVEYADILVLSKLDVLDRAEPGAELEAILGTLNPQAVRVMGARDHVTRSLWRAIVDPVMDSRDSGAEETSEQGGSSSAPGKERGALDDHAHDHVGGHADDHAHRHAHDTAHHDFDTVWLPIENVLDFELLEENLESLPASYVRIKGIAQAVDASTGSSAPRWIAFHRVGTRVSSEPLTAPSRPRVVAVGPGIEQARLAACLDASVVPCDR